jgi:hypothetical protein
MMGSAYPIRRSHCNLAVASHHAIKCSDHRLGIADVFRSRLWVPAMALRGQGGGTSHHTGIVVAQRRHLRSAFRNIPRLPFVALIDCSDNSAQGEGNTDGDNGRDGEYHQLSQQQWHGCSPGEGVTGYRGLYRPVNAIRSVRGGCESDRRLRRPPRPRLP